VTAPGGNVVEIRVRSIDETGPAFDSAAKRARELGRAVDGGSGSAGKAFESAERKASGLRGTLTRIGEVAGGVLAAEVVQSLGQRAIQLVQSTTQAASSLGESVNAVKRTFGAAGDEIVDWGEKNAASFGLSQRAFNQMAVPLGAMLKNQGLSLDEVGTQVVKLTERAADMASVFDTDVASVLAAIQAGLRGEADPLERFGVGLSAAAVDARALADSGKTLTSELTTQEKALARLNVIYDQTATTAGDFEATSDSLANAQRQAAAHIENAQAKLGEMFIPVMAKAAEMSANLAQTFSGLPQPVIVATGAIIGLGAAAVAVLPRLAATKAAMEDMGMAGQRASMGLGIAAKGLGALGLAIAGAQIAEQSGLLNEELDKLGVGLDLFTREQSKNANALEVVFGPDGWLDRFTGNATEANRAGQMIADGMTVAGKAAAETKEDIAALTEEVEGLLDKSFELDEAQDAVTQGLKRLADQLKEQREENVKGAGALTGNTQAALDNRDAVRDLTRKYEDLIRANQANGKSSKNAVKDFENQLVSMGFARDEARRYARDLGKVKEGLENIEGTYTARVRVVYPFTVLEKKGKRDGGIVGAASGGARGGMTMVGEEGPEIVDLPYGSTVRTAGETREMMRGGGGGPAELRLSLAPGMQRGFMRELLEALRVEIQAVAGTGSSSVQKALGR
jgi:hypothetical protein